MVLQVFVVVGEGMLSHSSDQVLMTANSPTQVRNGDNISRGMYHLVKVDKATHTELHDGYCHMSKMAAICSWLFILLWQPKCQSWGAWFITAAAWGGLSIRAFWKTFARCSAHCSCRGPMKPSLYIHHEVLFDARTVCI